jgi:probable rRNA maturation factor
MPIQLVSKSVHPVLTNPLLQRIFKVTGKFTPYPKGFTISIVVVDNKTMQALNKQYREVNAVTDVLSFPYTETEGEIVLCYPQAVKQAKEKQADLQQEIIWLVIHGILHVLGYDHETPADAKVMRPLERTIISHV